MDYQFYGNIVAKARHLGSQLSFNNCNRYELECRHRAVTVAWLELGKFWHCTCKKSFKRAVFMSKVVEAALSATCALVLSVAEYNSLTVRVVNMARSLLAGKACDRTLPEHPKAWPNNKVLKYWKLLPLHYEDAIRKIKWLQAMLLRPLEHLQVIGSIFGTIVVSYCGKDGVK